jgi:hypothetical protein
MPYTLPQDTSQHVSMPLANLNESNMGKFDNLRTGFYWLFTLCKYENPVNRKIRDYREDQFLIALGLYKASQNGNSASGSRRCTDVRPVV